MQSLLASVRHDGGLDRVDLAVRTLEEEWRHGEPNLEELWAAHDPDGTTSVLAALVKTDLRCRFARGDRPAINDYLDRFPTLRGASERMLSLIYEEFCLREEQGERVDTESFCQRYAPWRDSLLSQLKYHELLSRVVGLPTAATRFPEPGEHFEDFAIESVLGRGGAARVYRAREGRMGGREVALKVSPNRGQEPEIMARLDHEHIVPVHSVVFQPETELRGLIMPYRPGLALDEVIRRVNPASRPPEARIFWDVVEASARADTQAQPVGAGWGSFPMKGTYAQGVAWIIAALARAVAYSHEHGIQHRDIKPANVLLTLQNGPQLLDFNLAHEPHAAVQAEAAMRGGTLPYMAPEQLEAFIDPARWNNVGVGADVYALGLVMYELLTGQPPEVPDQSLPLPRAIRSLLDRRADLHFAPRRLNPAIPHALEAITIRCLAYNSDDRYPGAQALADDLRRFLARQPLQHAVNPSSAERLGNWTRRNVLVLVLAGVVGSVGSYRAFHRFYPVERQGTFLAAMAALHKKRAHEAIGLLGPLVVEHPNSTLVLFALAVAQQQANDIDKAAESYGKALLAPDAEAVLVKWGRDEPDALLHFEELGPALRDRYPELARAALGTAMRLGSTDYRVITTAAYIDDVDKSFAAARDKWTKAIDLTKARTALDSRDPLVDCYQSRARTLITWGADLLQVQALDANGAEEVRSHLREALDDLDTALGLIIEGDDLRKYMNDYLQAEAEIGLCDLELGLNCRHMALEHHNRAKQIVDQLTRDYSEVESFKRLTQKLADQHQRIEAMSPQARSRPAQFK